MILTAHFTLEEMIASETARVYGIDNTPPPAIVDELRATAYLLEQVREILADMPIVVTSGYRCLALNRAVRSLDTSTHVRGMAVDFLAPRFGTPLQVCRRLQMYADRLKYDQLIYEFGTWTHIGRSDTPRMQDLTINNGGTVEGISA